jgi:V/A-type H+/Na+-transporting ATPase subunit I
VIFADRMKQLVAVVLDVDSEAVTRELLRLGAMHMIRASEAAAEHAAVLGGVKQAVSMAMIGETRKRVEGLLHLAEPAPGGASAPDSAAHGTGGGSGAGGAWALDIDRLRPVDLDTANRDLERIGAAVHGIRERQRVLQQEILRLEEIGRQVGLFRDIRSGIRAGSRFSFLSFEAGSVPLDRLEDLSKALREWPSVQIEMERDDDRARILVICLRRDEAQVNAVLEAHGWLDSPLGDEAPELKRQAMTEVTERLGELRRAQQSCVDEIRTILAGERAGLEELWANLRMNELRARIQSYFSTTARTMIFAGWVPASMERRLDAAVRRATDGMCLTEWHDPSPAQRASVPVLLRNPRFLAPFQMLVQNYATPAYGTVDPTVFVAFTYLTMFGLMFGDAGHGAVLVLAGIFGLASYRDASDGVRSLLRLIVYCGFTAMVAGILFGSTFGFEWPHALWFDYHAIIAGHGEHAGVVSDVYGVLAITLYFGIAVISLGLLLNWVNLVVTRRWADLLLSKGGIVGGWLYGVGVYTAFGFAASGYRTLPPGDQLFWMFGLPALLLLAGPFVHYLHHRHGKPFGPLTVVDLGMEWLVELLEIFSGYLANTLSFMRVAGLGIAHVSLMIAFFEIARMVGSNGAWGPWSWLVVVFGNTLVILLEGLSAGIQSLRLNYYEFFSKYFSGSGTAYMPVSLRARE